MSDSLSPAELALREAARDYHRLPTRGKISVNATKPLSNQRDLSLAYSPGVAYPCLDIQADPSLAVEYTSRGNLVAVISNGTIVALPGITPTVGLHSICVAPVFHSGSYWWRYSYDGGTTAEVAMGTTYAAPTTTAAFGAFCRADTAALQGQGHDLAIWLGTPPTVASGLMATIATLPGTPTYRLPESASTGVPAIRVEANRYDPTFPLVTPVTGLPQLMTVGASVRKVAYP